MNKVANTLLGTSFLVAFALAGVMVADAGYAEGRRCRSRYGEDDGMRCKVVRALASLLELHPETTGYSTVTEPCDYAQAQGWVEGYQAWCAHGDGGFASGSTSDGGTLITMTAQGTPVVSAFPQCPSGSDCAPLTGWRQGGTADYYESAADSMSVGDGTLCVLYEADAQVDFDYLAAVGNAAGNSYFGIGQQSGNMQGRWSTACGSGSATSNAILPLSPLSALHLACITVSGTTLTPWGDGTAGAATNSTSFCGSIATSKWAVGGFGNFASASTKGKLFGGFWTRKILTSGQMTALANATLGTLTTSQGGAVTTTRATAATCQSSDGGMTVLPNGRPCVAQNALLSEPAATQLEATPQNIGGANVNTNCGAAPTVTNNTTDILAPDGTYTATKLVFADTTGCGAATYNFAFWTAKALTAAAYSSGVWMARLSGSGVGPPVFASNLTTTASYTQITPTAAWQRVKVEGYTATAVNWYLLVGFDNRYAAVPKFGAQTVYVWNGNTHLGSVLTSDITTASTRNATVHTMANPLTAANANWCVGATFKPGFAAYSAYGTPIGGGAWGAANSWKLGFNTTGQPGFWVYNNSTALKSIIGNANMSVAQHDLMGCNNNGTMTLYVDGSAPAATTGGTGGDGVVTTQPGTLYVGYGGEAVNGWVSNLRILPRGAP